MTRLMLAAAAALLVAACLEEGGVEVADENAPLVNPEDVLEAAPATEPATDAVMTQSVSTIDWAAAQADLAAQAGVSAEGLVTAQSSVADAPPAVPILLPSGIVTAQSSGGVRFRPMDDGYFAAYPGDRFDIIVNGTNVVADAAARVGDPSADPVFTATVAGAQVALSRYGADYLIEFECHEFDPGTTTCIEELEALNIAESLIVAGTR